MPLSTQNFADVTGETLNVTFDPDTGSVEFDGYGETVFGFDGESLLSLVQFLVDKINSLTPEPLVTPVVARPLAVVADGASARENFNLTVVQAAKELGLSIAFRYAKNNSGVIESRTLAEVEAVNVTSKGHTVVFGYDEDREDVRSFRVDWIKGYITVTD